MARGPWNPTDESIAKEAYAVLIGGRQATRTYSKAVLKESLARPGVYTDFLKHCLEWDDSRGLVAFRQGLLLTIQAIGASEVAKATGISRVTLYRMLGKRGNPTFASLVAVFRYLDVRLWIVEQGFIDRRKRLERPKDEQGSVEEGFGRAPQPKAHRLGRRRFSGR